MLRTELAELFEARLTVVGVSETVRPDGPVGAESETFPEKPFRLVTRILELFVFPGATLREEGAATIEYGLAAVTVCDATPTIPRESVAAMWTL